jgi:hypothetical protein
MINVNVMPSDNLIGILRGSKDRVGTKKLAKMSGFKTNCLYHW